MKFKKEPPVLGLLVLFVFLEKGACQIQPKFVSGLCPSKIKLWSKLLFAAQIHPLYLWICRGQNGACDSTWGCWNQGGEPRVCAQRKRFSSQQSNPRSCFLSKGIWSPLAPRGQNSLCLHKELKHEMKETPNEEKRRAREEMAPTHLIYLLPRKKKKKCMRHGSFFFGHFLMTWMIQ